MMAIATNSQNQFGWHGCAKVETMQSKLEGSDNDPIEGIAECMCNGRNGAAIEKKKKD